MHNPKRPPHQPAGIITLPKPPIPHPRLPKRINPRQPQPIAHAKKPPPKQHRQRPAKTMPSQPYPSPTPMLPHHRPNPPLHRIQRPRKPPMHPAPILHHPRAIQIRQPIPQIRRPPKRHHQIPRPNRNPHKSIRAPRLDKNDLAAPFSSPCGRAELPLRPDFSEQASRTISSIAPSPPLRPDISNRALSNKFGRVVHLVLVPQRPPVRQILQTLTSYSPQASHASLCFAAPINSQPPTPASSTYDCSLPIF